MTTQTRIQPIETVEREWHTIIGHEDLGEFPFSGSPALAKCDEIAAKTGVRPAYNYHSTNRPTRDVIHELCQRLKSECPAFRNVEYGFSVSHDAVERWPKRGWTAVYVVTGGNEGWYVHIDAICTRNTTGDPLISRLAIAKFLSSQDDALALANITTKLLGA